jgi:hypothetical protein
LVPPLLPVVRAGAQRHRQLQAPPGQGSPPQFLLKRDEDIRSYGADALPSSSHSLSAPNTLYAYGTGSITQDELSRSLARFCALGCLPLDVVDDPAMRGLVQSLLKRTRDAEAALPLRYQKTQALLDLSRELDEDLHRRMESAVAGREVFPG